MVPLNNLINSIGNLVLSGDLNFDSRYGGYFPPDRVTLRNFAPIGFYSESQLWAAINWSRLLFERNIFISGFIESIINFIGSPNVEFTIKPSVKKQLSNSQQNKFLEKAQSFWNEFKERNFWTPHSGSWSSAEVSDREKESRRRLLRDGEVWVRFFIENGFPVIRFVEPEQVRTPSQISSSNSYDYSWGVVNKINDIETIVGYWLYYPDNKKDFDFVEPLYIVRLKANTDRSIKRGLPDLFPVDLQANYLLSIFNNLLTSSKAQSAIAWVERYRTTHNDQIKKIIESNSKGRSLNESLPIINNPAGTVLATSDEKEFVAGPTSENSDKLLEVVRQSMKTIGWRWCFPDWFTDGAQSFASSLVTGSPFVRAIQSKQEDYTIFISSLVHTAFRFGELLGIIDKEILENIKPNISFPPVIMADEDKQIASWKTEIELGVMDEIDWMLKRGRDPISVFSNRKKFLKKQIELEKLKIELENLKNKKGLQENLQTVEVFEENKVKAIDSSGKCREMNASTAQKNSYKLCGEKPSEEKDKDNKPEEKDKSPDNLPEEGKDVEEKKQKITEINKVIIDAMKKYCGELEKQNQEENNKFCKSVANREESKKGLIQSFKQDYSLLLKNVTVEDIQKNMNLVLRIFTKNELEKLKNFLCAEIRRKDCTNLTIIQQLMSVNANNLTKKNSGLTLNTIKKVKALKELISSLKEIDKNSVKLFFEIFTDEKNIELLGNPELAQKYKAITERIKKYLNPETSKGLKSLGIVEIKESKEVKQLLERDNLKTENENILQLMLKIESFRTLTSDVRDFQDFLRGIYVSTKEMGKAAKDIPELILLDAYSSGLITSLKEKLALAICPHVDKSVLKLMLSCYTDSSKAIKILQSGTTPGNISEWVAKLNTIEKEFYSNKPISEQCRKYIIECIEKLKEAKALPSIIEEIYNNKDGGEQRENLLFLYLGVIINSDNLKPLVNKGLEQIIEGELTSEKSIATSSVSRNLPLYDNLLLEFVSLENGVLTFNLDLISAKNYNDGNHNQYEEKKIKAANDFIRANGSRAKTAFSKALNLAKNRSREEIEQILEQIEEFKNTYLNDRDVNTPRNGKKAIKVELGPDNKFSLSIDPKKIDSNLEYELLMMELALKHVLKLEPEQVGKIKEIKLQRTTQKTVVNISPNRDNTIQSGVYIDRGVVSPNNKSKDVLIKHNVVFSTRLSKMFKHITSFRENAEGKQKITVKDANGQDVTLYVSKEVAEEFKRGLKTKKFVNPTDEVKAILGIMSIDYSRTLNDPEEIKKFIARLESSGEKKDSKKK